MKMNIRGRKFQTRCWLNTDDVGQAFQPASSGDFPVARFGNTGLESPSRFNGSQALEEAVETLHSRLACVQIHRAKAMLLLRSNQRLEHIRYMDTGRPTKTAADYMVIALSPVLIMMMVHSFCFFLVEVFYRGEAIGGVRWVLFWFVLAVVLIARIGIEQGEAQAIGYSLALTFVVGFYLVFAHTNFVFAAVLLGLLSGSRRTS